MLCTFQAVATRPPYGQKIPNACRQSVCSTGLGAGRLGRLDRALRWPALSRAEDLLVQVLAFDLADECGVGGSGSQKGGTFLEVGSDGYFDHRGCNWHQCLGVTGH